MGQSYQPLECGDINEPYTECDSRIGMRVRQSPEVRSIANGSILVILNRLLRPNRESFHAASGRSLNHIRYGKSHKLILWVLSLSCFITPLAAKTEINYPDLNGHPFVDFRTQATIFPFLLPLDHPMKGTLDSIFSQSRVIENERTLINAGFEIIAGPMPRSFIIVARHPGVPGFVFKLYLDSEPRCRKEVPHWLSLARRCIGAEGIRKIIERKKIQHFLVPDKWLYLLPIYPYSGVLNPESVILIETDMELESYEVTKQMWKTVITTKHLDELYSILKHGYGGRSTISISANVPFTKQGKFAFTDTEGYQSDLNLKHVKKYLSDDMKRYWDSLIKDNPK